MTDRPPSDLLLLDIDGPVATLTLNRPEKKNALSIALRDAVSDALDELAPLEAVKVVVLTGAGSVFSAGFDLSEFSDHATEHQAALWSSSDRFHHTVLRFPLPTIAAVNGAALAGGFDLACLTDIRLASTEARFAHPEHQWAPVVYRPLLQIVGGAHARDLAMTGRSVDADEALRIGLVSAVTAPGDLLPAAQEWAGRIADASRDVLLTTKAKAVAAMDIDPATPTLEL